MCYSRLGLDLKAHSSDRMNESFCSSGDLHIFSWEILRLKYACIVVVAVCCGFQRKQEQPAVESRRWRSLLHFDYYNTSQINLESL